MMPRLFRRRQAPIAAVPVSVSVGESPELLISHFLRAGVMLSMLFVGGGMLITFLRHPDYFSSAESLHRLTAGGRPHRLPELLSGVKSIGGQAFVMMGLLWLIWVPFVRVALSIFVFRQQRDKAFVRITTVVLALLLLSAGLGKVLH
jgi:uncharacterized membrane protein